MIAIGKLHRIEYLSVVNIDSCDESAAQFQANLRSFETSVETVTRSKLKADKLNNFLTRGDIDENVYKPDSCSYNQAPNELKVELERAHQFWALVWSPMVNLKLMFCPGFK